MISQKAIEAFLNRKLENYDWLKQESPDAIIAELSGSLPPEILSKLWQHQRVTLLLLHDLKRFMSILDMGAGKTFLILALILMRKLAGEKPRAVVFVPFLSAVKTWIDETAKHTPALTCTPLLGSTKENLQAIKGTDSDLYVICYQSAVALCATKDQVDKKGKGKWGLSPELMEEVFQGVNMLVGDEWHKVKNQQSLTYRLCRKLAKQADYAFGLTGTPFGRDLQDLWAQFYLIDFGETLGETMGLYRAAFFKQKINFWGGYEYTFKKGLLPKLQQLIKNRSLYYSIDEMMDLPAQHYTMRKLTLSRGAKAYVKEAREQMQHAQVHLTGNERKVQIELSYMQLRRLSSGYMSVKDQLGKETFVHFDDNPKLEELEEFLETLPDGGKVLCFHHFRHTNEVISKRLAKLHVGHARLWSGQHNPLEELTRFEKDPKCRVLVVNSRMGSSNLNLQFANYVIFFEQPEGTIDRQQAERRAWRPGQTKPVMYYDFLVEGTADERLYWSNKAGKNLLDDLLKGENL